LARLETERKQLEKEKKLEKEKQISHKREREKEKKNSNKKQKIKLETKDDNFSVDAVTGDAVEKFFKHSMKSRKPPHSQKMSSNVESYRRQTWCPVCKKERGEKGCSKCNKTDPHNLKRRSPTRHENK